MENYELYITPLRINPVSNRFRPGHIPFNKDKKWSEWMDGRKQKKVKKNLELGRGNCNLPGANRRAVVAIKDGKLIAYRSATDAAVILKAKGIKINKRNICAVCHCKRVVNGKYSYVRKTAGGYTWYFADNIEKYRNLVNNE